MAINPNILNVYGETPLVYAIILGRVEMCKEFLKHPKIDVNLGPSKIKEPIAIAAKNQQTEICQALVKHPKINKDYTVNITEEDLIVNDLDPDL